MGCARKAGGSRRAGAASQGAQNAMTKIEGDVSEPSVDERPPVYPAGAERRDARGSVEEAMDESLRMSFPASDPPAWGCLGSR